MQEDDMKKMLIVTAWLLAVTGSVLGQRVGSDVADSPEVLLKRAVTLELTDGQPRLAAARYRDLAARLERTDRRVAAQALLRAARSYERIGSPEAARIYADLAKRFGDQPAASEARARTASARARTTDDSSARRLLAEALPLGGVPFDNISPDGRYTVIGVVRADDDRDLVLRDVLSGTERTLLDGSARLFANGMTAVISPDGTQVAYVTTEPGPMSIRLGNSLYVVGTEPGARPRQLIDAQSQTIGRPIGWSADGKALLAGLASRDRGLMSIDRLAWVNPVDGATSVIVSFEPWRMPAGLHEVSLSPKGDRIAFSAPARMGSADRHISIVGADGQGETAVVKIAGSSTQPIWTPDGSHLVFVNQRALWAVAVPHGAVSSEPTLVHQAFAGEPIAITQAGDLYFSQSKGGDASIVIGGSEGPVQSGFNGFGAAWSPDGRSIAFLRDGNLIIRTVPGGEERRATMPGLDLTSPRWLPDGSAVIVRANQSGPSGDAPWFHIARSDDGSVRPLFNARTTHGLLSGVSTISPDGRTLYASVRQREGGPWTGIVASEIATGSTRLVFTFPDAGLPKESQPGLAVGPDGATLAILGWANPDAREARIFTVRTDGTDFRVLHGPFAAWNTTLLRWAPDGRSLAFVGREATRPVLLRMPASGGAPETDPLTSVITPDSSSFDLSPDGTRIVTNGRNPMNRELWVLDNFLSTIANVK
jgi:Tol biopolymer transport system component